MNSSIFYMTSTVLSLSGLWLLWELGIRPLLLDNFRDSLFTLRDRLYKLSQEGHIDCDSQAYRTVESFLNGVIRYAHRFTFFAYIMSQINTDRTRSRGEDVDFSKQLKAAVETTIDPIAKKELQAIVLQMSQLIVRYAAKSSLIFLAVAGVYFMIRPFLPVLALTKKKEAVSAFEREAYLASQFDAYAGA